MAVHWDHNWVCGTQFESVRHLILYDFAIHWFDMLNCFMGSREPKSVFASFTRSATQDARPALLAQAVVQYEGAQASLVFDGDTRYGPSDTTYVTGSRGTLSSHGVDLNQQSVSLTLAGGEFRPQLSGRWFSDGFHGTMGELLCAVEEGREPENGAADNLRSLALCFAAVASAERGEPVAPGSVERLPEP
jgi:predicted dehydrogenase